MAKRKTTAQQAEALESPVRMDGVGEDPAIRALLSDDFTKGTNLEAAQIAMALQEIIRGQRMLGDEIIKVNERMNRMDVEASKREQEQQKYIQKVLDKAESLKAAGFEKDRIIANGTKTYQEAMQRASAEAATRNLRFAEELKTMPKELVVSPGEIITVVENGQNVAKLIPEVVRIRNRTWVLQPGVATEVPMIVAQHLRNKRHSEKETAARKELLSKNLEASELSKKWQDVGNTFGSSAEPLPSM